MPKKRRNGGRSKSGRGHTQGVPCTHCGRIVPKDKAIKRYTVRNMVDASSLRDIKENRAFDNFSIPKLYTKLQYCISCGIHLRVVRVRNVEVRRSRAPPPQRVLKKEEDHKPTAN
jgi:small subunit ribosomal protein S26e